MKLILGCCIAVVLLLVGIPGQAAHLELYDDFQDALLDPDEWVGSGSTNFRGNILESRREIVGNRLQLRARAYGHTLSNEGDATGGFSLAFPDPEDIEAIEATVEVSDFLATGCPANPTNTRARIRLSGTFFNVVTPIVGRITDDVFAAIEIRRRSNSTDAADLLEVTALVGICGDRDCTGAGFTLLGFRNLGHVTVGTPVRLRIEWDPVNNRFLFERDRDLTDPGSDDAVTGEQVVVYTVPDEAPPGFPFKRLELAPRVANCTTTPRPVSFANAFFDDVFVKD